MRFLFALAVSLLVSVPAQARSFNLLVNRQSNMLEELDRDDAFDVFSGTITTWDALEDSGLTGSIQILRLADSAPATQAFKNCVRLTQFGANMTVITGAQAPLFLAAVAANMPRALALNATTPVLPGDRVLELDDCDDD